MKLFEGVEIADLTMRFEILMQNYENAPKEAQLDLIDIYTANPSLFFGATFRWITRPANKNKPSSRYLAKMTVEEGYLTNLLADPEALAFEEALLLAESMAHVAPGFDSTLLEKFLAGSAECSSPAGLFRVLEIVSRMDNVGRTNGQLVQFLRHKDPRIRSKVVELLLHATQNTGTAVALLNDSDDRVRANALEGLWPLAHVRNAQQVFRLYTGSPVPRVAVNALIGLCLSGDQDAIARLMHSARSPNFPMQRAAIWAMGYLALPQFVQPLRKVLQSSTNGMLRGPVLRALVRINRAGRDERAKGEGETETVSVAETRLRAGRESWNQWRAVYTEPMPNLEGVDLSKSELTGYDFSFTCLRGANLSGARLNLCSFFGADLANADLTGAQLCRSDLRAACFNADTNFRSANLRGASLYGLRFDGNDLIGATFDDADLTATEFLNCTSLNQPVTLPQSA